MTRFRRKVVFHLFILEFSLNLNPFKTSEKELQVPKPLIKKKWKLAVLSQSDSSIFFMYKVKVRFILKLKNYANDQFSFILQYIVRSMIIALKLNGIQSLSQHIIISLPLLQIYFNKKTLFSGKVLIIILFNIKYKANIL